MKWRELYLGELMPRSVGSVNPARHPTEVFDLYSVPAYDSACPDVVLGSEIGSTKQIVMPSDVLLSKIVPHIRRAWVVGEKGRHRQIASSEWIVFRGNDLLPDYFRHFLVSDQFHVRLMQTVSGVGGSLLRARSAHLRSLTITLPPLPEQKRIATILDKADEIRRKRAKTITLADDFLKSTFLDMFGDPVENPKGWDRGSIRDLLSEVRYGTSKKAGATGQFPVLRMGNITVNGRIDLRDLKYINLSDRDIPNHTVQKGDILFNRTNSRELVGKTAVWRANEQVAFAGYLVRARTKQKGSAEYISAYLNSHHGKCTLAHMCKNIVGMANINAQEFQDIPILLPPIDLQRSFTAIVYKTDDILYHHGLSELHSSDLFSALSQKAFQGEL